MRQQPISKEIAGEFNKKIGDDFIQRIREASEMARRRKNPGYPADQRPAIIIGELRRILAKICIDALTPDLIILDEFQRFAELLHEHDADITPDKAAAAELARALFSYKGTDGSKARLLLLDQRAGPSAAANLLAPLAKQRQHFCFTCALRALDKFAMILAGYIFDPDSIWGIPQYQFRNRALQ